MSAIWQLHWLTVPSSRSVDVPDYNAGMLGATIAIERLPTEAVGATSVTFKGVSADSEIRVYFPDGTEAAGVESCAADQVLSWPVYGVGSANNTVTVRVVNWLYKIKEFTFESSLGNVTLPIQQERDKWALNPA